jgi:hypothetical protein
MKSLAKLDTYSRREVAGNSAPTFINGFNSVANNSTLSKLKPQSQTYVHLGTTSKHLYNSKPQRKTKSEKLQVRSKTRESLVNFLGELGEDKTAGTIALCGQKFEVLHCNNDHIAAKTPYHRCNVRYCPMCANRRAGKYQRKYLPYALEFVKQSPRPLTPCLLTLTQVKIKGERLIDSRERVYRSYKNLTRHKFFREYFAGGIYAIENTFSEDGNHCHMHLVVFRKKFVDVALLKQHWASVSTGAKNLNIRRVDTLENGLRECLKYIAKPLPADNLQRSYVKDLLSLKGKRMLDTFGEFKSFMQSHELPEQEIQEREKLQEGSCCPRCNDSQTLLFRKTMTELEIIEYYRRREVRMKEMRELKI